MDAAAGALFMKMVERIGLPLALVFVLGVAVAALYRQMLALMKEHRAERETDRAAHLAALEGVGGHVDQVGEKVADVQRGVERILDRLPAVAHALVLALALVACAHRSELHEAAAVEVRQETHATVKAEEHKTVETAKVVQRHRAPRRMREKLHTKISYAATPEVPAHVVEQDRERLFIVGPEDTTATSASKGASGSSSVGEAATGTTLKGAATKDGKSESTVLGFPGLLWPLCIAGLLLALVAGSATFIRHAGGFFPAVKLLGALLRRLFGGGPHGDVQG